MIIFRIYNFYWFGLVISDGVDAEEIAEYFTEMMDAELNTQIEDGSDVLVSLN